MSFRVRCTKKAHPLDKTESVFKELLESNFVLLQAHPAAHVKLFCGIPHWEAGGPGESEGRRGAARGIPMAGFRRLPEPGPGQKWARRGFPQAGPARTEVAGRPAEPRGPAAPGRSGGESLRRSEGPLLGRPLRPISPARPPPLPSHLGPSPPWPLPAFAASAHTEEEEERPGGGRPGCPACLPSQRRRRGARGGERGRPAASREAARQRGSERGTPGLSRPQLVPDRRRQKAAWLAGPPRPFSGARRPRKRLLRRAELFAREGRLGPGPGRPVASGDERGRRAAPSLGEGPFGPLAGP